MPTLFEGFSADSPLSSTCEKQILNFLQSYDFFYNEQIFRPAATRKSDIKTYKPII